MKKKLWIILTIFAMVTIMTPMMGLSTHAEEGEEDDFGEGCPAMVMGTEIVRDTSNTSSAHTVYMADKAWKVIGYGQGTEENKQVASNSDTMTLISPGILKGNVAFDFYGYADYSGSILQGEVNKVAETFTTGEKCAIAPRTLTPGEYDGTASDGISGSAVNDALLWPLSGKEAYAMNDSLRVLAPESTELDSNSWWLRSQFISYGYGTVIKGNGVWSRADVKSRYGLRPAFNLSLRSVCFLSAVQEGKDSGEPGADALKAVGTNTGNEWKLTLIDDNTVAGLNSHTNFTASRLDSGDVAPGGMVTLSYSGAKAGENEYVSVVLKDMEGQILYYGHLAQSSESAEEVSLNIPLDLSPGTYVLGVFAEQCNGTGKTDYASEVKDITIKIARPKVQGRPSEADYKYTGMTWSKDLTAAKANIVSKTDSSLKKTIDAKVESVTVDSTCQHNGITVYIATVVLDGVTYTETKVAGIDPKKHKWDAGKVTTPATTDHPGVRTYTCIVCGVKKTEVIKKKNQEKRESAAVVDQKITSMKNDGDITGSAFSLLQLKSSSQTKKSITLQWKKAAGAKKYVIYGNACGKKNKMKKLASVESNSRKIKKIASKKLKKGTYYKFIVVALDKNNKVVSSSKTIHVATKGGKVGNHGKVSVKVKTGNKTKEVRTISLKKGSSLELKTKLIPASNKKIKKHVDVRYESSRKNVATVSKKGVIKTKKKGNCVIYVYAQNGVAGQVKVVVK